MRRKRSDELPRFVNDDGSTSFRWRRHYALYALACLLFVYWLLPSRCSTNDDGNTIRINWSRYAYSLYATDSATLCHAILIFDALAKFGSKADRVLFYPQSWDTVISSSRDRDSQLLVMARDKYKVKLQPISLLTVEGRTTDAWTGTWDKSVTKFMAFSLAYYDRVIALDSDITLLQSIDELFLLPKTPIAMPRAYWYESKPVPLTSMLMVITPDLKEFERLKETITGGGNPMLVGAHKFDMELINERFEESAMVLPHRPYSLLSGEFRRQNHSAYLGDPEEKWDADKVLSEAKIVHFSDWPLPKPWIMWPLEGLVEIQPDCGGSHEGSCRERQIWKKLYGDFRANRKSICMYLSEQAPDWHKIKGESHEATVSEGTAQEASHVEDHASKVEAHSAEITRDT